MENGGILFMRIDDILRLSDEDIDNLSESELNDYVRNASKFAKSRRTRALSALSTAEDAPLPQAYLDWNPDQKTSWLAKTGIAQYKSWRNIDFDTVGSNKKERLKIITRFLSTKTSTKGGQEDFLTNFRKRLGITKGARAHITKDMFSEFWRIINALSSSGALSGSKYKYIIYQKGGQSKAEVYSTTTELQRMVWDEMYEDKFQGKYDADLSIDNDEYAQRIMNKILSNVVQSYEQMEQRRLEEEEISRSEQPTGIFRGGI